MARSAQSKHDVEAEFRRLRKDTAGPDFTRAMSAQVRALSEVGMSDWEICRDIGLDPSELATYKRAMYAQELVTISQRDPAEIFIDYRLQMEGVCRDLDEVYESSKGRNPNAAVGALKAKSQIIDKIMERGQEMGVIPRAAKKHEVVGGLILSTLSDGELLAKMKSITVRTRELLKEHGEGKMNELTVPNIYEVSEVS